MFKSCITRMRSQQASALDGASLCRAHLFADDAVLVAPCEHPLRDMRWVGGVRAAVRGCCIGGRASVTVARA